MMEEEAEINDDLLVTSEEDEVQPESQEDDIEIPTFADEGEEQEGDTDLVRHLRAELRRTQARAKELEVAQAPKPKIVIGEKPTLEGCEWDEEKFETELTAWHERKRQADAEANAGREAEQK